MERKESVGERSESYTRRYLANFDRDDLGLAVNFACCDLFFSGMTLRRWKKLDAQGRLDALKDSLLNVDWFIDEERIPELAERITQIDIEADTRLRAP